MIWFDAHLTVTGVEQARSLHDVWKSQILEKHIPTPQSYYCSPHVRCLETAKLTFSNLPLPPDRPFKVTIKENLRETIGRHTCDKRRTKSEIAAQISPDVFSFEEGFVEGDELWDVETRETKAETDIRVRKLLDDVFTHDRNEIISFTCHSGVISSLLRLLGHWPSHVAPGGLIPIVVRAEKI